MKPFRATLAALLLLATASTAYAGPLEDALAASKKSDYATALRLFRPLAEKGNVVAQSALGFMYETSEGVPQDYAEAAKWYRLAAAQGDAFAQTRLGYMYDIGVGVARDFAAAAKLFRGRRRARPRRRAKRARRHVLHPAAACRKIMSRPICG